MNLRRHKMESPRIDITPLIDVVFLMLIFFMVSTTFDKQTALKVELPSVQTNQPQTKKLDEIHITLDRQGKFSVNTQELAQHDAKTLSQALRKIQKATNKEIPIFVSGDRNAPMQAMVTIMEVAAQLGMSQLHFVAQQQAIESYSVD